MSDNKQDLMNAFTTDMVNTADVCAGEDNDVGQSRPRAMLKYNYNQVVSRHQVAIDDGLFAPYSNDEMRWFATNGMLDHTDPVITGNFEAEALPKVIHLGCDEVVTELDALIEELESMLTPEPKKPETLEEVVEAIAEANPEVVAAATAQTARIAEIFEDYGPKEAQLLVSMMCDGSDLEEAASIVKMAIEVKEAYHEGTVDDAEALDIVLSKVMAS